MDALLYNNVLENIGKLTHPSQMNGNLERYRGVNIIPLEGTDALSQPIQLQEQMKTNNDYTGDGIDKALLKTPMECNSKETYWWSDDLYCWCTYKLFYTTVYLCIWDCSTYRWIKYSDAYALVPIWQNVLKIKLICAEHGLKVKQSSILGAKQECQMSHISILSRYKIKYSLYDERFAAKRVVVPGENFQHYWTTTVGCPMIQRTSSQEIMFAIVMNAYCGDSKAGDKETAPHAFVADNMKTYNQYAQEVFGNGQDKTIDDTIWKKYSVAYFEFEGYAIRPYSFSSDETQYNYMYYALYQQNNSISTPNNKTLYTFILNVGTLAEYSTPEGYANMPHSTASDVAAFIGSHYGVDYPVNMLCYQIKESAFKAFMTIMSCYQNDKYFKWTYIDDFYNILNCGLYKYNSAYTNGTSINGVDDSDPLDSSRAFLVNKNRCYQHANGYEEEFIGYDFPSGSPDTNFKINMAYPQSANVGLNGVVFFKPINTNSDNDLYVSIRGCRSLEKYYSNGSYLPRENDFEGVMMLDFDIKPYYMIRFKLPTQKKLDSADTVSYKHSVYSTNDLGEGTAKLKFDINNIDINGDVPYEGYVNKW